MNLQSILKLAGTAAVALVVMASTHVSAQGNGTVLKAVDAQKLLPSAVYYKGQSAPVQARNSGGVKFADGYYVLATLVDTSGYSTGIAAKYQGYLIVETPITVGGMSLPAGVYGFGFIADNKFVITDVGAHDVFTVDTATDQKMKRPMPLQVEADPGGGFRLYEGRKYVQFSR
jgi:acetyl-CoA carboxylase beta subunit